MKPDQNAAVNFSQRIESRGLIFQIDVDVDLEAPKENPSY